MAPWIVFAMVDCLYSPSEWHSLRTQSCLQGIEKAAFVIIFFDFDGWEHFTLHHAFCLSSFSSNDQVL